jgi:hypothetical protein
MIYSLHDIHIVTGKALLCGRRMIPAVESASLHLVTKVASQQNSAPRGNQQIDVMPP